MTNLNMGVLILLSHLVITCLVIGGYIYTLAVGMPDETMKTAFFMILAYWFGAAGLDKVKPKGDKPSE